MVLVIIYIYMYANINVSYWKLHSWYMYVWSVADPGSFRIHSQIFLQKYGIWTNDEFGNPISILETSPPCKCWKLPQTELSIPPLLMFPKLSWQDINYQGKPSETIPEWQNNNNIPRVQSFLNSPDLFPNIKVSIASIWTIYNRKAAI